MDRHFIITYRGSLMSFPGNATVVIGQTSGCDIWLPNNSVYEDVLLAKIVPNRDHKGWHIIKTGCYYPVTVNGATLNRVHYLSDGDNIEVLGHHLRFNIKEGGLSAPSVMHIHKGGKLLWCMVAIICVILGLVGFKLYDGQKENISEEMRADISASVFTTRVDSLHLMHQDSLIDSYVYAAGPVGTAFLTSDSLIVTARHCIQPWLNMVTQHEYANIPHLAEWPISKALYAETQNQLTGEDSWQIVSYITLTDEEGNSTCLSSDKFCINTDLDDIVELGTYNEPMYWRSISHRYSRRDMMLGDIAVAKGNKPGNITLANRDDIERLLARRGVKLTFVGHPESSVNGNLLDFKSDELRLPIEQMPEYPGHIFMLAHEGGLTPGFSGGPVIVRDGAGFKAVGVVSVVDERNGNRSYSVPSSEVISINK